MFCPLHRIINGEQHESISTINWVITKNTECSFVKMCTPVIDLRWLCCLITVYHYASFRFQLWWTLWSTFLSKNHTVNRDHRGQGFLALKYHPKASLIFTLWHLGSIGSASPSSKMFQIIPNPFQKLLWNFKNSIFSRIFYWLTDWLTPSFPPLLMPSDKCNSTVTMATGLISSLFNVALSGDVPQQLQCLHHGFTKARLCSPLYSIPFSFTA